MATLSRATNGGERSQADQAYESLRDLLITLEIAPGAPLAEPDLMQRIGVGRTPLREAVHRLETERLVTIFPRRGTFASAIDIADLALITDLREELEGHAASRAAERATDRDRADLRRLADDLHTTTFRRQIKIDTVIHRRIYVCARNHFLTETATQYHNLSIRIWHLFRDRLPDISAHVEEHADLLDAISAADSERARSVAAAHVRSFEKAVRALL